MPMFDDPVELSFCNSGVGRDQFARPAVSAWAIVVRTHPYGHPGVELVARGVYDRQVQRDVIKNGSRNPRRRWRTVDYHQSVYDVSSRGRQGAADQGAGCAMNDRDNLAHQPVDPVYTAGRWFGAKTGQ